jgi:dienelactone hydrolase
MLRIQYLLPLLCGLSLLSACSSDKSAADERSTNSIPLEARAIGSIDTTFESRGVVVPATIVSPASTRGKPMPLVVIAHGHGGSREEGGSFPRVAAELAALGIASIRMDFPGCGDSTESFAENNLSNMLLDLQAARVFAESQFDIDETRVGLLGYSMGGRLVALLSEIDPSYQVMATWAPAVSNGAERELTGFGGPDAYRSLKEQAQENGSVVYETRWGTELELGARWFTDMEETFPQAALAKFSGPLLVVYGDEDESVPPSVSAAAASAATSSSEVVSVVIPTAKHGLGFYTNRPEIADQVVETTVNFLAERL